MSFAAPDRLLWLLAALPIIGLYILKTRLRKRQVSTLLFWDQLFEEKRQRTWWRDLRHWLSLLMQLLILLLVVAALSDPAWSLRNDNREELILIVDNSASMQAVNEETGETRLQTALDQAGDYITALRPGNDVSLLTAGSTVDVAVGRTDFPPSIAEGLRGITPTDGPTRVDEAIEMARRLCSDDERRRIVVFSDQRTDIEGENPLANDIEWVIVGQNTPNVAITSFNARRSIVDPIGYSLFVEVSNFSEEPADGRLTLKLDGTLIDVFPYSIEPGDTFRKTFTGTSQAGGILAATIDAEDGLTIDNTAQAIIPARPTIPVTLISESEIENYYLNTVLESIPLLEVTRRRPDEVEATKQAGSLLVYDRLAPETLPDGPILIVAGDADGPELTFGEIKQAAWKVGPALEAPLIVDQADEHPLLRHVHLENVLLQGGRDISVSEQLGPATTLVKAADGSQLLVAIERPAGRILILSGDLETGDLPLRIAFPVMMTNAVNWFLRQSNEFTPTLTTGEAARVAWETAVPASTNESRPTGPWLVDPEGNRHSVAIDRMSAAVGPLKQTGIYGLFAKLPETSEQNPSPAPEELMKDQSAAKGHLLAVNLCNAAESDLSVPTGTENELSKPNRAGLPAWLILALVSLLVVLWEWRLYQRRIIA